MYDESLFMFQYKLQLLKSTDPVNTQNTRAFFEWTEKVSIKLSNLNKYGVVNVFEVLQSVRNCSLGTINN